MAIRSLPPPRSLPTALGLIALAGGAALAADGRIPIVKPAAGWPFTITAAGSYYLTEDLFEAAPTEFIHVDADNVTIDLEGHAIRTNGTTMPLVKNINDRTQIRVTNGFLIKGSAAVQFNRGAAGTGNYVVDHLRCIDQTMTGIAILGNTGTKMTAVVEHNLISGNGVGNPAKGIELQLGNDSYIDNNVITGCVTAIFMDRSEKNSIRYNNLSTNGSGILVISVLGTSSNNNASYNVISGCNAGDGIHIEGKNSTVTNNTVSKNNAVGIRMVGDNFTIANNTSSENLTGIFLMDASGGLLQNNTTSGNAGPLGPPGAGDGIYLDLNSNYNGLDWNVSSSNQVCGIEVGAGATGNILANNRTPNHPAACTACEPVIPACAAPCGPPPCAGPCARAIPGILNAGAATFVCSNLP